MRNPKRYAVLLRVRKLEEDLKARDMAVSRTAVQRAQRERTSLELIRRAALNDAGKTLLSDFDAAAVRSYYQYERHLAVLRDQKDAEIRTLQLTEAEKQEVLEHATQNRRIAEKLDQNRKVAFKQYLGKEEQKALDEVATMYAARNIRNSRG